MKAIPIIAIAILGIGCEQINNCPNPDKGKAVLVAYRVSPHSHIWLKDPITGNIYDVNGLGGRREPSIRLGDTIEVDYGCGDVRFDKEATVRVPENRETRFVSLKGYEYLHP